MKKLRCIIGALALVLFGAGTLLAADPLDSEESSCAFAVDSRANPRTVATAAELADLPAIYTGGSTVRATDPGTGTAADIASDWQPTSGGTWTLTLDASPSQTASFAVSYDIFKVGEGTSGVPYVFRSSGEAANYAGDDVYFTFGEGLTLAGLAVPSGYAVEPVADGTYRFVATATGLVYASEEGAAFDIDSRANPRTVTDASAILPLAYQAGATVRQTTAPATTYVTAAAAAGTYSWSPAADGDWELTHTVGGTALTAKFTVSGLAYHEITWKQDAETVLGTTTVAAGLTPGYPDPTKDADASYTYAFAGWSPVLAAVTGAATYTATWTPVPIDYAITYDLDGGTAENPTAYNCESADIVLTAPVRELYTFVGWTGTDLPKPALTVTIKTGSTGARTYTANWLLTPASAATSEIAFDVDTRANPRELTSRAAVDALLPVQFMGSTVTEKQPSAATRSLTDAAWKPTSGGTWTLTLAAAGQTATFTVPWYVFQNGLGTLESPYVVSMDDEFAYWAADGMYITFGDGYSLATATVPAGYAVTPSGTDGVYRLVASDATYIGAESGFAFDVDTLPNTRKVTVDEILPISYRAGATVSQTVPTSATLKDAASETADGTFALTAAVGTTYKLSHARSGTTLTATFEVQSAPIHHTITWKYDEETVLDVQSVEDGVTPAHQDPANGASAQWDYGTVEGWTPAVVAATADATYTATWSGKTRRTYTVTWTDENGLVLGTDNVEYGTTPSHEPLSRESDGNNVYTFNGWFPEPVPVKGDATYRSLGFTAEPVTGGSVTGPATLDLGNGVTVTIPDGVTVEAKDDGTVEVPEGAPVTVTTTVAGEGDTSVTTVTELVGKATIDPDPEAGGEVITVDGENGGQITCVTETTADKDGNITEINAGGGEGTDEPGVKVTVDEGGSIEKQDDGTYKVTGPATITLPTDPETVIDVPEGETVTVAPDGTITKVTENGDGTTTTEKTDKDGNVVKEKTDKDGNITEIDAGGTEGGDGTADKPGVKVTTGEGGSIVKQDDGTYVVTGPATITLPTDPETVIDVPESETVTVAPDGRVTVANDLSLVEILMTGIDIAANGAVTIQFRPTPKPNLDLSADAWYAAALGSRRLAVVVSTTVEALASDGTAIDIATLEQGFAEGTATFTLPGAQLTELFGASNCLFFRIKIEE